MKAQHGHHVTPKKTLFIVFGALVTLTILTAVTAQIDLGRMNVPLALLIAGSKATLVVMFFMALKYDKRVNTLVFALGGVFVTIFMTMTLFDTVFRGDLGNVADKTIFDMERAEELMREREAGLSGNEQAPAAMPGTAAADTADTSAGADSANTSVTGDEAADTSATGAESSDTDGAPGTEAPPANSDGTE